MRSNTNKLLKNFATKWNRGYTSAFDFNNNGPTRKCSLRIKMWSNISVFDEERPCCPADVASEEIVEMVREMILTDRRTKVRELAGTVINILHDKLSMRKVPARWVLRLLTDDNKQTQLSMSRHCLDLLKRSPKGLFRRVVTVDETWIIIIRQRPNGNPNNGFFRVNLPRRKQRQSHRPER
ncbi:hypothetical protein RI129_007178 [Pyrocoelia pectoralis]|uniref:Transposase n=1 Tax=Pyrocoelia pectoralis TaxID=417401 RepID=A0AAN7VAM3_9COLE